MKLPLSDIRPGMLLSDARPYVLEPHEDGYNVVQRVSFTLGAVHVETPAGPAEEDDPKAEVVVTSKPPRVLMSWDEDSQTWAILVDTTNGSGRTQLNIALNDAELFDGVTDPERDAYGHTEADHEAAGACVPPPSSFDVVDLS